jgi:anti-sigma B factor antagonist
MQVVEREAGDVTILILNGRLVLEDLDASLRPTLEALIQRGRVKLVLDLTNVNYIDSAGVGFLVSKYTSARRRGGDLKLVDVTPRVERVLEITRLVRVFELFDTQEQALHSFVNTPIID